MYILERYGQDGVLQRQKRLLEEIMLKVGVGCIFQDYVLYMYAFLAITDTPLYKYTLGTDTVLSLFP